MALVYGRINVDVPDCATIHANITLKKLGWEYYWNRARRETSLTKVVVIGIVLVELCKVACVNINTRD